MYYFFLNVNPACTIIVQMEEILVRIEEGAGRIYLYGFLYDLKNLASITFKRFGRIF